MESATIDKHGDVRSHPTQVERGMCVDKDGPVEQNSLETLDTQPLGPRQAAQKCKDLREEHRILAVALFNTLDEATRIAGYACAGRL